MSVVLKDVIKQVSPGDMKLVAGRKGLGNPVEWVHMVDNIEISNFLTGGELAFTTGIGLNDDVTLLDLVKSVYGNEASGMVVNVGPYIGEIPREVIAFGDDNDFPIFEVPWSVRMAGIMRIFVFTIMNSEQRAMEISQAFRHAISMPDREELYTSALMQKGYLPGWSYVVAVLDICDRLKGDDGKVFYSPLSRERLEMFCRKIEGILAERYHETVVFAEKDSLVCIFSDMQEARAVECMRDILRQLRMWFKASEAVFTSVGKAAEGFLNLSKSHRIAVKMKDFARSEHREEEILCYSDAGMYQLLFQIEDTDSFYDYYGQTVKALDEYDTVNDSNLMEVLELYMNNNGSVQQTAAQLFVHRNTINYKLKKIEALLNVDLTSFRVRNELALGVQIAKILKSIR
jgi:hypothetical protein